MNLLKQCRRKRQPLGFCYVQKHINYTLQHSYNLNTDDHHAKFKTFCSDSNQKMSNVRGSTVTSSHTNRDRFIDAHVLCKPKVKQTSKTNNKHDQTRHIWQRKMYRALTGSWCINYSDGHIIADCSLHLWYWVCVSNIMPN